VLLNNAKNPNLRLRREKLDDNWHGPYRIRKIPENSTYYLIELDGIHLATSIVGNRLKKFYSQMSLEEARYEIITREKEIEEERDDNPQSAKTIMDSGPTTLYLGNDTAQKLNTKITKITPRKIHIANKKINTIQTSIQSK
jgi:homoserine kinase